MEPQRASKRQRSGSPSSATTPPQPQQAATSSSSDSSRVWLPEFVQRFAVSLPPNEVACTLRLVNKAAAAQFRGPQHATVRLSQPVPHHAFAWRWARTDGVRCLSDHQCSDLKDLTARSGSIANLEVLLAREDVPSLLQGGAIYAAAAAGQLGVCVWLQERGCLLSPALLGIAAAGGHQAVCEWLLANNCWPETDVAGAAARGGHVGLLAWLLGRGSLDAAGMQWVAACVAEGCDLPTLQRLCSAFSIDPPAARHAVISAAGSPTADWQAKVEWLEAQGCRRNPCACERAARAADALPRLQWLRQRGYTIGRDAAVQAAKAGNVEALQYVLGQLIQPDEVTLGLAARYAAESGHLAMLEVLHARGVDFAGLAGAAARNGQLAALAWLVDKLGARVLSAHVFAQAAASGSMEVMTWLREQGCPWDQATFFSASKSCSEEQLEWLVEQGCPMADDGRPYVEAALRGNVARMRCLRRLGCSWALYGRTLREVVERSLPCMFGAHEARALGWLLDQGCPVHWDSLESAADKSRNEWLVDWLRVQRQQRQQRA